MATLSLRDHMGREVLIITSPKAPNEVTAYISVIKHTKHGKRTLISTYVDMTKQEAMALGASLIRLCGESDD